MMPKSLIGLRAAKAKVFVVDDHPIVRKGLALLINREPDLIVCGDSVGGASAVQAIASTGADIVVLDLSLDGMDGLDILKMIRGRDPNLPVLILSMHDESYYAERALRAGANGYIMKQEATEKVLVAIRRILQAKVYLSEKLTNKMLEQFAHGAAQATGDPLGTLSDRELEVYRFIGAGRGTRQIAAELHLSVKTIESYQAHIKEKLGLHSGRQLVRHAIEQSLNEKGV